MIDMGAAIDQDVQAEKFALGSVMLNPDHFDALEDLMEGDLFRQAHCSVLSAIRRLAKAGKQIDPNTVALDMPPAELEAVGGLAYLSSLVAGVARSANAPTYVARIRDGALRRRVVATAQRIAHAAAAGELAGEALLDQAEAELSALRKGQAVSVVIAPGVRAADTLTALETAQSGRQRGVLSGLRDLDALTYGWRPGQFIVIGARPSQGKSTLGLQLAVAAGTAGPVLFVSLEMGAPELNLRELASRSGVAHQRLDAGVTDQGDFAKVSDALGEMEAGNVHLLDRAGATLQQIRSAARQLAAAEQRDLALVVIDYLQLIGREAGSRPENRTQEVAQMSAGLKKLARDLRVPVIALSQLSRESDRRDSKRPVLADLRESGALEQDADIVLLLHRPWVYDKTQPSERVEVHIAKQRNGPTGQVTLRFDERTIWFFNEGA